MARAVGGAKKALRWVAPGPIYRLYRQVRVAHLVSSYEQRVVEHTYARFQLQVCLADPLAASWYDRDWPETKEIAILRESGALREGSLVFDLGAHQGVVALILARLVGFTGRVVAVEAERHNVRLARRNLELNDVGNVEFVWAAVSDAPGDALFAEGLTGRLMPGNSWGKIRVPAVTIDVLTERYGRPDAVVIDIEGAEGLALAGAKETIRRGTAFLVEVHVGCGLEEFGGTLDDVVGAFPRNRYGLSVSPEDALDWEPLGNRAISVRSHIFAQPGSHDR